jgi:Putative metal-binding motif
VQVGGAGPRNLYPRNAVCERSGGFVQRSISGNGAQDWRRYVDCNRLGPQSRIGHFFLETLERTKDMHSTTSKVRRWFWMAAAGTLLAACGQAKGPTDSVSTTQLRLTMDIRGATDVAGMQFDIQGVSCADGTPLPGAPRVIQRSLEDLLVPGDVPELADMPLDGSSSHVFADAFVALSAGCYAVTTTPTDASGHASADCATARLPKVQVLPGATTEVFLVNQCRGESTGAIDVASALNHPPEIVSVMFKESKFIPRCDVQAICATAKDPDSDPLEWSWAVADGPAHAGPRVTSTTKNDDGSVTQCVELIPQDAGKLEITLTVYDTVSASGTVERVEQWLADQGYPGSSRAALTFPVYSSATGRAPSPEMCDGIDNDCDFEVDEGLTTDADGDGFTTVDSCAGSKDDCNDSDPAVHPGTKEVCDKIDNNCDGQVDEDGVCKGPDPECAGQTCGNFTTCNSGGTCSDSGVCGSTAEGGGLCVDGTTACEGLAECPNGSKDCQSGEICFVNSCCARPVCVPAGQFCSQPPVRATRALRLTPVAPMTPIEGPTLGKK